MYFLLLPSLLLREQGKNRYSGGVVVEPGSFPQNHPGCLQTSLLKIAVLSLCTSGSHMERHELDMESPLAEVGGILA